MGTELTDALTAACKGVIDRVYEGETLTGCLQDIGLHPSTFYKTIEQNPNLAADYARAQVFKAETMVDEIVTIADTEQDAQKARNRITARQWYASKINKKKYGDHIDITSHAVIDLNAARMEALGRLSRPMSDQQTVDDAQVIESKQLIAPGATDTQSVTSDPAPEKGAP